MKEEKQTRERILYAAKQEFMEKGYNKASLRSICKSAGVTTGALYFFFEGKEDLFGVMVKEPLDRLYELMQKHYTIEAKKVQTTIKQDRDYKEDKETANLILDYLYEYHDEFLLLLTKSQGSVYDKCIDKLVDVTERHYRLLADQTADLLGINKLEDYTIHWLAHLQISSFAQYITHGLTKEEARKQLDILMKFLIAGWFAMFS